MKRRKKLKKIIVGIGIGAITAISLGTTQINSTLTPDEWQKISEIYKQTIHADGSMVVLNVSGLKEMNAEIIKRTPEAKKKEYGDLLKKTEKHTLLQAITD